MLRTVLVLILVAIGACYALQGPFFALLFYIGNAYFKPEQWVWTDVVRNLNLSFISGWFVVLASLFSRQRFVVNGRIVLLFLLLVHTFLSTLLAEHFDYSWYYWLEFLKIIVITYLIIVLVKDYAQFRLLLLVMTLALGLLQAKQGWVYLLTAPTGPNMNPVLFLGDNNGVALGMLMLVPVVALLAQTTRRKWARFGFWLLLIGALYRALSTYSRGGFIAGIAMGGSYWLRSRDKVRVLLATIIVIAVIVPALPDAFWDRMSTIFTYQDEKEQSALSRFHFWKVAVAMANAHPLLGVGHNGFDRSYDDFDFSQGKYGTERAVHSSFYGVLAELGYVGVVLYGLIVFLAFRSCHRVRKFTAKKSGLTELHKSAVAIETSLIAFLVGGSFITFQYNEMLWNFIGLAIVLEKIAIRESATGERLDDISNVSTDPVASSVSAET